MSVTGRWAAAAGAERGAEQRGAQPPAGALARGGPPLRHARRQVGPVARRLHPCVPPFYLCHCRVVLMLSVRSMGHINLVLVLIG